MLLSQGVSDYILIFISPLSYLLYYYLNLFVFAEDKDGTLKKVFIKKDNRCVSLNSDSELFHIQASDDAKFTLFHPIKI